MVNIEVKSSSYAMPRGGQCDQSTSVADAFFSHPATVGNAYRNQVSQYVQRVVSLE